MAEDITTQEVEQVDNIQQQLPEQPPKKLSVKDFAAKIKEKYPEYNSVADDVLVNKMIEKYPVYQDQVDISQKKNFGQPSKTGAEPNSNSIPTVQLESKSQLEKTPDWEENPLNPLAAANKAQAKKEEAQKIMPQPTPTIGKKVAPIKTTPQRKSVAQLPEQDEEDESFFAKAGEKLLNVISPTLGTAAQVVSSIPNAKDYLKYVWNRTLETTGRMASGAGGLFIDALSMGDDPNIPKEELLKTYRDKVAKNIREAPHEYLGANISKEKTKEFDDNFVASTIAGLPGIMVQAAVPFGAGFVADAMDGAIQTINNTEEGRKLPESQKTIFELGAGLAIGGMTALGIDKILGKQTSKVANNLAMKTFADLMAKNEGQVITKEMFEEAIQQNSKSLYNKLISTGGKLAESSLVGGLFSAGTEVTNEVSKQLTNKLTDKQVFDPFSWGNFNGNVAKSFGHGAATGFALGAITVPFNQAENGIKNEVLKAKTPQEIEALKTQVVEQVSQGSLDPIHAESIVNIIDSYNAANGKVPADVPDREQKVELVKQKDDLKQAATNKLNETKTVDDAFHPQIQQEATALLNRANELNQEITGQPSEPAKHSMYADPLELPELKEQIVDINRRIDLGGADGEKAKLELTEIKTDPAKFYENRKEEARNNLTDETELNKALETYDNIINKIKQYDKENISGLSGEIGVGEKPIEAQPVEGRGAQEIGGGGVLQAQGIEGEGKGVEGKAGEELTLENAKEGDIVFHNGEKVTVVSKGKSRKGADIIEVKQEPKTKEEIKRDALQNVFNRVASEYKNLKVKWDDIELNHPSEVRKEIEKLTALENSRTATYTIDAETWKNEVKKEVKTEAELPKQEKGKVEEEGNVGVGEDVMKSVNDKMRQTSLEMEFKGQDANLSFKNDDIEIGVMQPYGSNKWHVDVSDKADTSTGYLANEAKSKVFDTKLEALDYAKEQKEKSLKEQPKAELPKVGEVGDFKNIKLDMRYPERNEIIFVSPDKLLNKHAKDNPDFDVQKKENQIGNRVEKAKQFLIDYLKDPRLINRRTGERMNMTAIFEPSVVSIGDNGKLGFEDGRHRVLAAKELGITEVPIEVPKEQANKIKLELSKEAELPKQKEGVGEKVAPIEEVKKVEETKVETPKEEVKVEAEVPKQKESILTSKTDLKGDKKQSWMLEATEKEVEQAKLKDTPRGSQFYPKKISDIERAIERGKYEKAIEDGRMTAQDAKSIIESAELEVPKTIEDLIVGEKEAQLPKQKEQPKRKASDGAVLNRVDAKKVYQEVWKTDDPVDAIGAAQKWLATGGKVNRESFSEEVTGFTRSRGAAKTSISTDAIRSEFTGSEKGLPTINKAAHDIWESFPEQIQENISDQDVRNALIDQLQQYYKRVDLSRDYLQNYSPETAIEKYYKDIEERENVAFEKEMKDLNEWMQQTGEEEGALKLEEDYVTNLIKQYEEESRNEPRPIEGEDKNITKGETTGVTEEVSGTEGVGQEKPTEPKPAEVEPPVPPTEKEKIISEEEPEMTKMANAVNDAFVEGKFGTDILDDIMSKLQDTDTADIYNKVREKIKADPNLPKETINKILTTKGGSEADQAILMYNLADLKGRESALMNEMINEKNPEKQAEISRKLLDIGMDMQANALANRYLGRTASNIFRLRQLWVNKEMDLATMEKQYMSSKGIGKLTPEQSKEIQSAYNKIRETKAKLENTKKELDSLIQKNEELKSENEKLKELKDKAKEKEKQDRNKKASEKIIASKERISKAKDNLRNLRGDMRSGVDPRVAIEIGKIAAEKFYQGVVKLDVLVKDVLADVKDVFPDWTEEDVRSHLFPSMKNANKYYVEGKDYKSSPKELRDKIDEYKKLQKEYVKTIYEWQKDRRSDLMDKRPWSEKLYDKIYQWQRFAILSYPATFVKLAAVVGHNLILKPIRFGVQKAIASAAKGVSKDFADKMGVYGDPSLKALTKYYSEFIRNFSVANLKEQFSGLDTKEMLYGDKFMYDEWAAGNGLLEIPGRSHGYIKSFVKNPEFQFAHEMLVGQSLTKMAEIGEKMETPSLSSEELNKLKEEYDKNDVTNEDVLMKINKLSLEHGKDAILMGENKTVDKFRQLTKGSGFWSTALKTEAPIVKIPLNYINRALLTKYGLMQAITGKSFGAENTQHPSVAKLIFKGTEGLTEAQGQALSKAIMYGSMGATLFVLGYFNRKKIKLNEDGSIDLDGMHISKNLIHVPEFESFFSGAETAQKFKEKENDLNWIESFLMSDIEILKKNPFLNMLEYGLIGSMVNAFTNNKMKDEKKVDVLQDAVTQKVVNTAIPGFFKQPAQWMDTEEGKGLHPMGTPIKRKPEGDWGNRFVQSLEMTIPGLRQNVPASGEKDIISKEELESPKYKQLKDIGISIPKIRTRVSYQIKPDENHPKGIMNADEFKKFSDLVTKYSKEYTDEALGYEENIFNIKRLKELESKDSNDPKIQAEITEIKKELKSAFDKAHDNAIQTARNELGFFTK